MAKRYVLYFLVFFTIHLSIKSQDKIPARERFNWKEYYSNSIVEKDSINYNILQGNWIAYEINIFGEYKIGSKTNNQPKTIQINGEKYRKTLAGDFYSFQLDKNLIILETEDGPDSAYINYITKKELTITYKRNTDYEQYLYKK